jgi:hypothetical protein
MDRACSTHWREECIQVLVGELDGSRPLGRPARRLDDIVARMWRLL